MIISCILQTEIHEIIVMFIGCEGFMLPFMYLGVPIGANMSRIESWTEVVNKLKYACLNGRLRLFMLEVG